MLVGVLVLVLLDVLVLLLVDVLMLVLFDMLVFLHAVMLVPGLPLGTEAPVMTPNGVDFLMFFSFLLVHILACVAAMFHRLGMQQCGEPSSRTHNFPSPRTLKTVYCLCVGVW